MFAQFLSVCGCQQLVEQTQVAVGVCYVSPNTSKLLPGCLLSLIGITHRHNGTVRLAKSKTCHLLSHSQHPLSITHFTLI